MYLIQRNSLNFYHKIINIKILRLRNLFLYDGVITEKYFTNHKNHIGNV